MCPWYRERAGSCCLESRDPAYVCLRWICSLPSLPCSAPRGNVEFEIHVLSMADPLSVTASAITVITTCSTCAKNLFDLIQCLRNAPDELQALSNDVNALKAVLHNIGDVCGLVEEGSLSTISFLNTASKQLAEAREILGELDEMLKESLAWKLSDRLKWILKKTRAKTLRGKVKDIKSNLADLLSLSTTIAS
jgi:hypothetical protein